MFLRKFAIMFCLLNLFLANAQTFTNYTNTDGLASNNVLCVAVDQSDNVWFGTQAGVSKFDGVAWTSYTTGTFPGLVNDNIQAIFIDSNNDPWIGTSFGTSTFNGTNWTSYTSADGLGNEQIKCIGEDASGNMWFGTSGGLTRFDGSTWTNFGVSDGIPFGGVNSITLKSNGDLWLGTGLSGIRVYDGNTFNSITSSDGLISDKIRTIAIGSDNYSWIGTSDGITLLGPTDIFQTNFTTILTLPAPDTLNPIEDIKIDGNGNVWVGIYVDYLVTEGGVSVYNGNQWFEYETADGLIGPVVRALAIDADNNVWVATSSGVSKISDSEFLSVSQKNIEKPFLIYPNPAKNIFSIRFDATLESSILDIYNSQMQLVKSEIISSNTGVTISTEGMSPGIYFVKLDKKIQKLIVQ